MNQKKKRKEHDPVLLSQAVLPVITDCYLQPRDACYPPHATGANDSQVTMEWIEK